MENLCGKDSEIVNPDEDFLLGVDLTEYFGGVNFNTAKNPSIIELVKQTASTTKLLL